MTRDELTALMDDLAPVLREFSAGVTTRLAALEQKSAEVGQPGPEGKPGRDGRDGMPGLMGIPGEDGKNGKDGLGFDDLSVLQDGERTITLRFSRGEVVKDFTVTIPAILDRGVFKEGTAYHKGDGVTWAGSFWIAQDTTTAKPGISDPASRAWRLAVKKGADGKDGQHGKDGAKGRDGKDWNAR